MPKIMTLKEFLISFVEKFNAGSISSLIDLYELDACFAFQPGRIVNGVETIRQSLEFHLIL